MPLAGVAKDRTTEVKRLSQAWLFTVISCRFLKIRLWVNGIYKLQTIRPAIFASLPSNVISVLCSQGFLLRRGNGFGCSGKRRAGMSNPQGFVRPSLDLRCSKCRTYWQPVVILIWHFWCRSSSVPLYHVCYHCSWDSNAFSILA